MPKLSLPMPGNSVIFATIGITLIAISALMGMSVGEKRASLSFQEVQALQQASFAKQQNAMQSAIDALQQEQEITAATHESMQQTLAQTHRSLIDARSKLRLYERIEGRDVTTGLGVDSVKMSKAADDNQEQLLVTLYQARGRKPVSGKVGLVLNGSLNGKPWREVVHDAHSNGAPGFKMRFFEQIVIPLPKSNLDIQSIEIAVVPDDKPHKPFKYKLAWAGILLE